MIIANFDIPLGIILFAGIYFTKEAEHKLLRTKGKMNLIFVLS